MDTSQARSASGSLPIVTGKKLMLFSGRANPGLADAIGHKLGTMGLETFKTSVTAIRRQGIRALDPDPDTVLELGDIVVLRGTPEGLQMAEERLSPR